MRKKIVYLVLLTGLLASCHKDTIPEVPQNCHFTNFRYYNGAKDTLGEMSNNYLLVAFDSAYTEYTIRRFIASLHYFDQRYPYTLYSNGLATLKFGSPKTCEEITGIISSLQKESIVEFAHYTLQTNDCLSMIMITLGNLCVRSYSNLFNVEVYDPANLNDLYKMIAETRTELVEQNQFMKQWFTIRTTKNSRGDALQMANYFYESKLFAATEPELSKFPVE